MNIVDGNEAKIQDTQPGASIWADEFSTIDEKLTASSRDWVKDFTESKNVEGNLDLKTVFKLEKLRVKCKIFIIILSSFSRC